MMDESKEGVHLFLRYPKATLIVTALLGFLLVAVSMELVVRVMSNRWAPTREERAKFWRYDPVLGWSHRPGQKGRLHHRDFSIDVTINFQGLRDAEYPVERTSKKRMLLIGDSYGWGFGVEQRQCVSEIIEKEHPEWEIINASVSGYSTDQQYLYMKARGMCFKPDAVMLLFYENDFVSNNLGSESWYFKPYFVERNGNLKLQNSPVPTSTIRQKAHRFFFGRTYVLKYLYAAGIHWLDYLRSLAKHNSESDIQAREQEPERAYAVTEHLLRAIKRLCIENSADFIIVSVPMEQKKRVWMQDFAQREKIPYLALDSYFESKGRETTLAHDKHWNPVGHQIAANAISGFLRKLGLF